MRMVVFVFLLFGLHALNDKIEEKIFLLIMQTCVMFNHLPLAFRLLFDAYLIAPTENIKNIEM